MKPTRIASGLLSLVMPAVLLAGCGFFESEEREPWRAQAEAACYARGEVHLSSYIQRGDAINGPGICGVDRPLRVSAIEDGQISLGSRALALSCPMTAALEKWVQGTVVPAAYANYVSPVVEIRNFGTYNCRPRNNVVGARLSEHAFANAFDFVGVKLANGHVVTVKSGWYGSPADRAFLRDVTAGACDAFNTVLGPGADRQHDDHLHLDLAHHNAAGTYHYCKPKPTPTNRPVPGPLMASAANPDVWNGATNPAYRLPPTTPSGFDQPLPSATVGAARLPPFPAATVAEPAPQPACPPGYVCTPVNAAVPQPVGPASLGWRVGASPVQGYAADAMTTGSIPDYSDD